MFGPADPSVGMIGVVWVGGVQLLIAVFAITQVARWSAEDAEGRLEMVLSAPVHRWRVVLERAAALTIASALIVGAGSLAVGFSAPGQGIQLDAGRLAITTLLVLPFALTFGGPGAVFAAIQPRVAVGV